MVSLRLNYAYIRAIEGWLRVVQLVFGALTLLFSIWFAFGDGFFGSFAVIAILLLQFGCFAFFLTNFLMITEALPRLNWFQIEMIFAFACVGVAFAAALSMTISATLVSNFFIVISSVLSWFLFSAYTADVVLRFMRIRQARQSAGTGASATDMDTPNAAY